ncbi:hypothetical protein B0H13DRAFT_2472192, partial [Mycena leptocephala]
LLFLLNQAQPNSRYAQILIKTTLIAAPSQDVRHHTHIRNNNTRPREAFSYCYAMLYYAALLARSHPFPALVCPLLPIPSCLSPLCVLVLSHPIPPTEAAAVSAAGSVNATGSVKVRWVLMFLFLFLLPALLDTYPPFCVPLPSSRPPSPLSPSLSPPPYPSLPLLCTYCPNHHPHACINQSHARTDTPIQAEAKSAAAKAKAAAKEAAALEKAKAEYEKEVAHLTKLAAQKRDDAIEKAGEELKKAVTTASIIRREEASAQSARAKADEKVRSSILHSLL